MKLRLQVTRAFVVPGILLALFTQHGYPEGSLAETLLESSGLMLLIVAAGGRVWSGAYVEGRKNRALVTEGPFSLVRNPLYLFSFLAFVGAGLSFGSVALAAVFALIFFVAHWPTIRAEERVLEDLFGDEYRVYRSRVPRFIPALRRPRAESPVELDAGGFLRTLGESAAILCVFVLARLTEWAKLNDLLPELLRLP